MKSQNKYRVFYKNNLVYESDMLEMAKARLAKLSGKLVKDIIKVDGKYKVSKSNSDFYIVKNRKYESFKLHQTKVETLKNRIDYWNGIADDIYKKYEESGITDWISYSKVQANIIKLERKLKELE